MRSSFIILAVIMAFFETGCASNQLGPGQGNLGGGTAENQQENSLGGRTSRINMQIGPPECIVR
jgi:hypothetical protein